MLFELFLQYFCNYLNPQKPKDFKHAWVNKFLPRLVQMFIKHLVGTHWVRCSVSQSPLRSQPVLCGKKGF